MEQFNLAELKESLTDFQGQINEMIKADPEYNGEADNLVEAIERVQNELSSINTEEELAGKIPSFADDLMLVMRCAEEFSEEDYEESEDDVDGDEFDFDDELEEEDDSFRGEFNLEVSRFINHKCVQMFLESAQFKALNASQKEHASHILNALSSYVSEFLLTDYHDLFVEDLDELCFDLFPSQFYCKQSSKDVPAVLIAFFNFLEEKKLLLEAGDFAKFVEENQAKIQDLLADEEMWALNKRFFMENLPQEGEFDPAAIKEKAETFCDKIEEELNNV